MHFRLASPVLFGITLLAISLGACAKEHSARDLIDRAGRDDERERDDDEIVTAEDSGLPEVGPHRPRDFGVDAGRRDAGTLGPLFDARVPDASAARDAAAPTRDAGAHDAGQRDARVEAELPPWKIPDAETIDVSVIAACDPGASDPDAGADVGTDAGAPCRANGWHTPPCYRAPSDCPALHDPVYCTGFTIDGSLIFVGLEHGATCRVAPPDPRYPIGPGSLAFAMIGPDLYTVYDDVVLKRAITDGTFDVAPVQASTIFAMGDALGVVTLDGSIHRFADWQALKSGATGELIATTRLDRASAFGASSTTIAAVWPDGILYLLAAGDTHQRAVRLAPAAFRDGGAALGLDLDEEGRVYVSSQAGILTYNSEDGRLLSRIRAPQLIGLSCAPGLTADAAPPVLAPSARPGYYAPATTEYILHSDACQGIFNGPRYVGARGGPELLLIGSFFHAPNTIRDERTTPHVLALTSIQSTQWNITVAPGAQLERIVINGSPSTVTVQAPEAIPMETFYDGARLGDHPGTWPSLDEARFRSALESQTGREVTEILGCHAGSNYLVRDLPPLCADP